MLTLPLICSCIFYDNVANFAKFDIVITGAADDGDGADAALCQVIQGQSLAWVVDENDGQIIDCLEHVRCCNYYFDVPSLSSLFLTLFLVV
jgi:hypothetical protein